MEVAGESPELDWPEGGAAGSPAARRKIRRPKTIRLGMRRRAGKVSCAAVAVAVAIGIAIAIEFKADNVGDSGGEGEGRRLPASVAGARLPPRISGSDPPALGGVGRFGCSVPMLLGQIVSAEIGDFVGLPRKLIGKGEASGVGRTVSFFKVFQIAPGFGNEFVPEMVRLGLGFAKLIGQRLSPVEKRGLNLASEGVETSFLALEIGVLLRPDAVEFAVQIGQRVVKVGVMVARFLELEEDALPPFLHMTAFLGDGTKLGRRRAVKVIEFLERLSY